MPLSIVITEDISRRVPFLLLLLLLLTFLPCRVISDSRVWVGVFCRKKVEYFFMLIGSSFFPMVYIFCRMLCDWNSMVANRFAQWENIWQGNFLSETWVMVIIKRFVELGSSKRVNRRVHIVAAMLTYHTCILGLNKSWTSFCAASCLTFWPS